MDDGHGGLGAGHSGPVSSWRVVGLLATAVVAALALLLPGAPADPSQAPSAPAPSRPSGEVADATEVLAAWDSQRAAAWSAGDAEALARLYAPGSRAAAADLRLLRRWQDAGWRVEELRTQVLALVVVRSTPDRLVLRVVDRVSGGRVVPVAAATGASDDRPLPGTAATARTVELRRVAGAWQLVASSRAEE